MENKSPSDNHVRQIQEDLACPQCEYNLRGLSGDVVECPECGFRCDVAKLVINRWTRPWFKAPGLSRINTPVACAVIGFFGSGLMGVVANSGQAILAALCLVVMLWLLCMVYAYMLFNRMEGLLLSLLAHIVFFGYIAGAIGVIAGLLQSITSMLDYDYFRLMIGVILLGVFLFLLWLSRRIEKYIAYRCVKQYLRYKAEQGSA